VSGKNGMSEMIKIEMVGELRKVLQRLHYQLDVMLVCARWYAAYPLSFRHLEEVIQEWRGCRSPRCASTGLIRRNFRTVA
jgi:hypothetical protein